jgi:hypothetical protein
MNNVSTSKTNRKAVPMTSCPGCSCTKGFPVERQVRVFTCADCGGLVGDCYLGDSYSLVLPYWAEGDVPAERQRYFDLTCLGSNGLTRRHGWFDTETRRIVQVG